MKSMKWLVVSAFVLLVIIFFLAKTNGVSDLFYPKEENERSVASDGSLKDKKESPSNESPPPPSSSQPASVPIDKRVNNAVVSSHSNQNSSGLGNLKKEWESLFLAKFPGKWRFTKNNQGEIFRISGDRVQLSDLNMTQEDFIQEVGVMAGLPSSFTSFQLLKDGVRQTLGATTAYSYEQKFLDMPVFLSSFKVGVSGKDGAIFMIDLSLKPVRLDDHITITVTQEVARQDVEKYLTNKYPGCSFVNDSNDSKDKEKSSCTIQASRGPYFFVESEPHEPVWVFNILMLRPSLNSIEMALGARSREVRYEFSQMVH